MPEVGHALGPYTLLKRLAVGGMGEVFLAAKPGPVGFGPYVALKVLREEFASDPEFVQMLVDEANISTFLNHQNVVTVLDLAEDSGCFYLAMEFIQGITVERLMDSLFQRQHKLPVPYGLYVAIELCKALKYAHTRVNHAGEPMNIIHRDVTPANILLSVQGEVKLTDFGIARAKGRVHQTQAGVIKGKFGYMAPEMVRYEQIDARADIFCAGVVAYLLLSGQHPASGCSVMEAIMRFEEKRVPPPSSSNPAVNRTLDAIVLRALEPKVADRWPNAAALGDALQQALLENAAWRKEATDVPLRLAQLTREVAPEIFEEPVARDVLTTLLSRARGAQDTLRPSRAAPRAHAASELERPSASSTSRVPEETAPPTAPRPAVPSAAEVDTDKQLQRRDVLRARAQLRAPTAALEDDLLDDDLGTPGAGPSTEPDGNSTSAYEAAGAGAAWSAAVEVRFSDPSADPRSSGAALADPDWGGPEASVEAAEPTVATFAYEPALDRRPTALEDLDQRTMVGPSEAALLASLGARPSSGEVTFAGAPTVDVPPSGAEGGGGSKRGGAPTATVEPASSRRRRLGAQADDATFVPLDRAPHGRTTPVGAVAAPASSPPAEATVHDAADATLLDSLDLAEVAAALAAAQRELSPSGAASTRGANPAWTDDLGLGDLGPAVAHESRGSRAEAERQPPPRLFDGPIRIVMDDDGAPALDRTDARPALQPSGLDRDAAGALAATSAPAPRAPMRTPVKERNRLVAPTVEAGASPHREIAGVVGSDTGLWMAGQLDSRELEWSDEAAARRVVATRNRGAASPPTGNSPPLASPAGPPSPPARAAAPTDAPRSSKPLLGAVAGAVVALLGVGYVVFFSALLWPSLQVDSRPAGASVLIDGELQGATPLRHKVAPGRAHRVEVEAAGHLRAVRVLSDDLGLGKTYALSVELEPFRPRVLLPADGTVSVNGKVVGRGRTVELPGLPPSGAVTLRVEAEGYESYEHRFEQATDLPAALDVPMARAAP